MLTPWQYSQDLIQGFTVMVKKRLVQGWSGHLMTMMFNQLPGDERQKNQRMQQQVEGTYASFLTRLIRRPSAPDAIHPVLIACADFPVPKHEKKSLSEITINDGLHYHGVLLVPPESSSHRLKVSIPQHFIDNQSHYLRDEVLNRVQVNPFNGEEAAKVTDYALKGLKTNRLPNDENLLILPKPSCERRIRPYLPKVDAE